MSMSNPLRKIVYENTKSKDYHRNYINSVMVLVNPTGDLVVDFCEEYAIPNLLKVQTFETGGVEFEREDHERGIVSVCREMKSSMVMSKDTARDLANLLLQYASEGDEVES